jgi:predicted AAA+ superfamily ATPase
LLFALAFEIWIKNLYAGVKMKRRQLDYIKEWANRKTRRPLIIRGARQVGKTTLVQLACKEMGLELIELNM